jgi:hypothetical protein
MEVEISDGGRPAEGGGEDVPPVHVPVDGSTMKSKVKYLLVKKCRFCRRFITKSHMSRHLKTVHPNHCIPKSSQTKVQKRSELKLEAKIFKCPSPCKAGKECSREKMNNLFTVSNPYRKHILTF